MDNSTLDILDNDELLSLTRWQLDQEQLGNALISVKHALKRDDCTIESHRLVAKIYAQLGLYEHAKKAFEHLLELEPDALTEKFQYGMVFYDNGDSDKAIDIWSSVLDSEATYPPALFYSALAKTSLNQQSNAIEHLNILIKSAPSDNLYFERGRELIRSIEENKATGGKQDGKYISEKYATNNERTIN
ncbi:hypothetical protein MNBD_GAMMA08-1909 [hydrothermal vent metagenome]|uniref:Uncharacterized protein n=1 Tax=hydrothermal vent metagenome TaxID=652676 RepID=A0A3B0XHX3_9ZZZZ